MDIQKSRQIASKIAVWYHQNNLSSKAPKLQFDKTSKKDPKFDNDTWARLMSEAILSFSEGLDNRISSNSNNSAISNKDLFDAARKLAGDEAFQTIAFLVSAAETRRPMEEELDVALQEMPEDTEVSLVDPQSFLPSLDLTGYLTNEADNQAYGQFSTWLMQMSSQPISQGAMHQATKYLQDLSKTPGLSQGFAMILSSMGAEYQKLADQYTRQSGEGQFQSSGDLPTGIQFQGSKITIATIVKEAYKRVASQMGISADA